MRATTGPLTLQAVDASYLGKQRANVAKMSPPGTHRFFGGVLQRSHIVIFRTAGSYIDYSTYNCQELGLAKTLADKGYRVSLIMGGPKQEYISYKAGTGTVDIYYLACKAIHQSLCIFDGWKELLTQLRPSIIQVHEFGLNMSFLVTKWAKSKGIKTVLIQGNYETTKKPILKQYEHIFNTVFGKSVLKKVDAIGCKTKAAVEYVGRYCNRKTMLTPVGLDTSKMTETEGNWFTNKNDVHGKRVLLYVGKMEQRRNPLFLLKLMKELGDEYVLVLVGDGPLMPQMMEFIGANKLTSVIVVGKLKQEELPAVYNSSDLFLLASDYEIFGMVILEAMYFGVPVISSSTAGSNTIITNDSGTIIPSYDKDAWITAIKSYYNDSNRLILAKQACRNLIRDKFVWGKAVDNFITLYQLDELN